MLRLSSFRKLGGRVDAPARGAGSVVVAIDGGLGAVVVSGSIGAATGWAEQVPLTGAAGAIIMARIRWGSGAISLCSAAGQPSVVMSVSGSASGGARCEHLWLYRLMGAVVSSYQSYQLLGTAPGKDHWGKTGGGLKISRNKHFFCLWRRSHRLLLLQRCSVRFERLGVRHTVTGFARHAGAAGRDSGRSNTQQR